LGISSQPQPEPTDRELDEPRTFACEVEPERDAVRVRPVGSLDMATASVLEQQLEELRAAGFRRLIVDLGGLTFMDSSGLRLALQWHAAAQQDGFEIGFLPGSPAVQRVFELTGMTEHVPFVDH
jgi:anti-sigma B factor antagonist